MTEGDRAPPLPGFMPDRLPENAPAAEFDAKAVAKALLRTTRAGALATIDRNTGHPFASLVNVATDIDGRAVDPRFRGYPPIPPIWNRMAAPRYCLASSRARRSARASAADGARRLCTRSGATDADEPRLRRRFLARHPKSELYADFADFSFWRLSVVSAHLNARLRARCRSESRRRDDRHLPARRI